VPPDVGGEDVLEGRLDRDAREADDRVHAPDCLADGRVVGEAGGDRVRLALDGPHVEQAQPAPVHGQRFPHGGADAARGDGEQNGAGCGHPRFSPGSRVVSG
jgi:hypothetical protein